MPGMPRQRAASCLSWGGKRRQPILSGPAPVRDSYALPVQSRVAAREPLPRQSARAIRGAPGRVLRRGWRRDRREVSKRGVLYPGDWSDNGSGRCGHCRGSLHPSASGTTVLGRRVPRVGDRMCGTYADQAKKDRCDEGGHRPVPCRSAAHRLWRGYMAGLSKSRGSLNETPEREEPVNA